MIVYQVCTEFLCSDYILLNLLNRAYRTAICKAKRGGFKDTHADDLLAPVLKVRVSLPLDFVDDGS